MASLKPNKLSIYDGKRYELSLRSWLYQVQQYLSLIRVGNGQELTDQTKIEFATSYMTSTAAAWLCTLVSSITAPKTWQDFEKADIQEFIPFGSVQKSRDKLRRQTKRYSAVDLLFTILDTIIRLEVKVLRVVKQNLSREKSRSAKIK